MFSHLRAVLLATATLLAAGTLHTLSGADADTQKAVAQPMPTYTPVIRSAQLRTATAASIRAIAIGY